MVKPDHYIYTVKCRGCETVIDYISLQKSEYEWAKFHQLIYDQFEKGFTFSYCEKCKRFTAMDLIGFDAEDGTYRR